MCVCVCLSVRHSLSVRACILYATSVCRWRTSCSCLFVSHVSPGDICLVDGNISIEELRAGILGGKPPTAAKKKKLQALNPARVDDLMDALMEDGFDFDALIGADQDGDGVVSPAELQSWTQSKVRSLVEVADADGDGEVSLAELQAFRSEKAALGASDDALLDLDAILRTMA